MKSLLRGRGRPAESRTCQGPTNWPRLLGRTAEHAVSEVASVWGEVEEEEEEAGRVQHPTAT